MISALCGFSGGMDDDGAVVVMVGIQTEGALLNGVGYRVVVNDRDREAINVRGLGAELRLVCRTFASENDIVIFGFLQTDDRRVFGKLIAIHGLGPATGMRLLSKMDAAALRTVVASKDVKALCAVPGIGKTTAAKIVAELKP